MCECQNGGVCHETNTGGLECVCPEDFLGARCETFLGKSWSGGVNGGVAPILIPILVVLLLVFAAGAAFYIVRKRPL